MIVRFARRRRWLRVKREEKLSGGRRMIGPAIFGGHLHAFNDERRRCFSSLRWGRTPGFLIGQIQAKFREAAEQKHSRPENHEKTGLTISLGSNCPLVRRRLASAAGTNRLGENQVQQSRGQKEWSRAKELHENTSIKNIDRANPGVKFTAISTAKMSDSTKVGS